jgi:hypothetical protein
MRLLRMAVLFLLPYSFFFLAVFLPIPVDIGTFFRYQLNLGILVLGLWLYMSLKLENFWGELISFTSTLVLFAFSLNGLWTSAASEMQVMGGIVFFSDAFRYYGDSLSLLSGNPFSNFSARHALAPGLITTLLSLTGHNLQIALAIQVAIIGGCIFLAGYEVKRHYGPLVAAIFLLLMFVFYRRFTGLIDSENLGVGLGAVGFALLLRTSAQRSAMAFFLGLFFTTLALIARPGAFLVLLCLLIAIVRTAKNFPNYRFISLIGLAAIGLGFLAQGFVNFATDRLQNPPDSNYAYTLYGIARGGMGWEQFLKDFPQYQTLPEPEIEQLVFHVAIDLLRQDPLPAVHAVFRSYASFISLNDESAYGWISGGDLTALNHPGPQNERLYQACRLLLWGMAALGLFYLWKRREKMSSQFILWMAVGLFFSAALIPPEDAGIMRVYAASIPILAFIPSVSCRLIHLNHGLITVDRVHSSVIPHPVLSGVGLGLAVLTILGPWFVQLTITKPVVTAPKCPPQTSPVVTTVAPGSYIRITDDPSVHTSVPIVSRDAFLTSLRQFPHYAIIAPLENLPENSLLLDALNLITNQPFWLVITNADPNIIGKQISGCGRWNPKMQASGLGFMYLDRDQIVSIQ